MPELKRKSQVTDSIFDTPCNANVLGNVCIWFESNVERELDHKWHSRRFVEMLAK